MALKTFVKVSSITNLSDARYCAGMGVDMLGFRVVSTDAAFIAPQRFQEIRGWITGPYVVAELHGLKSEDDLQSVMENYRPDFIELGSAELALLGGRTPLPYLLYLKPGETPGDAAVPPAYIIQPAAAHAVAPVLVPITDEEALPAILANPAVHGIVLTGSDELRPGLKGDDALAAVLEQLDVD